VVDAPKPRSARLVELLGLSDNELCTVLDSDALTIVSGQAEATPELAILIDLLEEAAEKVGTRALAGWVRRRGPAGRPIDALLSREFPAFERAVEVLVERGIVVGGGNGRLGGGSERR